MSRNRRRREEPASFHWEPAYRRSYSDECNRRCYAPPTELVPRNSFNYWRDDIVTPTSYHPQRSYGWESYNERWRDDSRSWHAESSYSRRSRDLGPPRDQDDRQSWRDRSSPHRNSSRRRHSTNTPPYFPRPTVRARSPIESTLSKPAPPEPPRKALPPPNMSSQPLKPSPGYLSLSETPSEILRDPAMARKLLVLDLNGTLLIRSARSRTTSGPQLRPVQPRPYMQSFRQYLFCPDTKAWLDTMVWSSAQPHSVDDMVDKVFGTTKGELKAVWNRKSLGLSEEEYHRKTVTTKDLTKSWDLFAPTLSPANPKGHSAVPLHSQTIHSALTTLLLDDSPHKAVLQPYNHVCIPEYDSTRRRHDLRSFLATKESRRDKKAKQKDHVETAHSATDKTLPRFLAIGSLTESAEKELYDVILLAVIGVLETVKLQSNVAGWIHEGGLWITREEGDALDVERHIVIEHEGKTVSNSVARVGSDASRVSKPAVNPQQAHPQTKMWFEDSSVVAFWVARGRRALIELGIQAVHGVTG